MIISIYVDFVLDQLRDEHGRSTSWPTLGGIGRQARDRLVAHPHYNPRTGIAEGDNEVWIERRDTEEWLTEREQETLYEYTRRIHVTRINLFRSITSVTGLLSYHRNVLFHLTRDFSWLNFTGEGETGIVHIRGHCERGSHELVSGVTGLMSIFTNPSVHVSTLCEAIRTAAQSDIGGGSPLLLSRLSDTGKNFDLVVRVKGCETARPVSTHISFIEAMVRNFYHTEGGIPTRHGGHITTCLVTGSVFIVREHRGTKGVGGYLGDFADQVQALMFAVESQLPQLRAISDANGVHRSQEILRALFRLMELLLPPDARLAYGPFRPGRVTPTLPASAFRPLAGGGHRGGSSRLFPTIWNHNWGSAHRADALVHLIENFLRGLIPLYYSGERINLERSVFLNGCVVLFCRYIQALMGTADPNVGDPPPLQTARNEWNTQIIALIVVHTPLEPDVQRWANEIHQMVLTIPIPG